MLDTFNREINYLRISVTDRCNLRCTYCMPEEGVIKKNHRDILTFEQIDQIVQEAVKLGINKVRITGGEPLVRKNIEALIQKLSNIDDLSLITLTTNGTLLKSKVKQLKSSGLNSINISLDTLKPEKYKEITRGGILQEALDGIYAAIEEAFPIKINMVVLDQVNYDEVTKMISFCNQHKLQLQLINHFSLNTKKQDNYNFNRPPSCKSCNRIRLLSDGTLKPCLHSDIEYKIDMNNISESLKKTILSKPEKGITCSVRQMVEIGG